MQLLVGQLGAFAAGLHAIAPPENFPRPDPLADLQATLETFDEHSPVFDLAIEKLAAEQPPQRDPVLLHGDLRLGNVIVGPDGLRAVLDWELTHAGQPGRGPGVAMREGLAVRCRGAGRRPGFPR